MATSPIITVSGFNLPASIGTATAAYMPDVLALRGANSIEQITTAGGVLALRTLTIFLINGQTDFWQLASGDYDSTDPTNSVRPLDYNAGTNNVHWQHAGDMGAALLVGARVTTTGATNIPSGVATAISFTAARFNSGEWDANVTPSRITAIKSGIYAVAGSASFAANVTGQRTLELRKNGSVTLASDKKNASSSVVVTNMALTSVIQLVAGDYVELIATQTSGGALDVLKADQYSPELTLARITSLIPSAGTIIVDNTSSTPTGSVGTVVQPLTITDAGWYRIWSGAYPASGNFNLSRAIAADGQTSDTSIDFTIIAGSPEGIINVTRNSVPSTGSPSIDGVRVMHDATALLAYVEVHLLRGGTWTLRHSATDTNYLDAPFLVADVVTATASLTYVLKPNVTGGTGNIDVPQINSGGNKLLAPNTGVTWVAATGTPSRVTFDTSTATLTQVAQHLKAVIDDLITQGVFQQGIPASMLYTDMLALSATLVAENSVANLTDTFRVSAAVDATVVGIYVPVGTFNGHNFYKIQGYEYEAAGQNSPRQCYWSSAWTTWTISNASGNLYHSGAAEANPWAVVQWKDQASVNVAVTTVAPNLPMTYNALTDTHTAMIVSGSTAGYNGLYMRGADLNAKRRYYLVGTSSNNKRIEWTGAAWNVKDDSSTYANSSDAVTYPDQVITWTLNGGGTDAIVVTSVNAVDLMSGVTVGDPASVYNGIYIPLQAVYNSLGGRKFIYRRTDGAKYLQNTGSQWVIGTSIGSTVVFGTEGNFPWNSTFLSPSVLTLQQNTIASAGWVNGATQPNTNITGNVTGNWHL